MTQVRAALIDAGGVYQGMVELEEDQLTSRHLPQITDCDLPPNAGYKWVVDRDNPFGGAFVPPPRKTPEQKFTDADPLPALLLFFVRAWKVGGIDAVPAYTLDWMRAYIDTFDVRGIVLANPEAREFYDWSKAQEKP